MDTAILNRIERLNYLLGGLASAVAGLLLPGDQALGVFVGVLIGSLNFSLIKRIVVRWLTSAASPDGTGASGFFMIPKMIALLAAIFLALTFLPISPIFLAAGFSVFFVSILIETARSMTVPVNTNDTSDTSDSSPSNNSENGDPA